MGNCMTSEEKMKNQFPIPVVQPTENTVDIRLKTKPNEIEKQPSKTEEERIIKNHRIREENERIKQIYNLGKLRETLYEDIETFLLNNILFSVQFFENFDRDRRSLARIRQKEQSRLNAEGPGGGLSSQRHKKRASLPDTMQETVGRWVSLDLSVIKNPTQKVQNSNPKRYNTNPANALKIGKEFLAPLRIMIVHEDVRVVEAEEEGLSRAIIPEPSSKSGYVRLRCVGDWEDESSEIYNVILRDKVPEISEDAEESPYPDYTGSERIGSEYSYSSQTPYEKAMGQGYSSQENFSSSESEDEEDPFNSTLKPRVKTGVRSISQRPPMKPPKDAATGFSNLDSEESIINFQGKQNGKSRNGLYSSTSNYPRFQNQFPKMADSIPKETENFKLTTTDGFGNIPKGFHASPKPSISTENSDSDYGYATIPPSYSPPKSARRHGGIPLQCLTNVRYRRIEGQDMEEEDTEGNKGEEFARRIEGNITYLDHLFIKKTFLDPSAFLKAFGEEVRWRESTYYSSANTSASDPSKNSLEVPNSLEQETGAKRRGKTNRNDSLDKISVRSEIDFEDDSLQAILGIPVSVPVEKKGGSWFSQRDRCGMRFPIEMTPSITIPWPDEAKVEWGYRERNRMFKDTRTNERRLAWPIRKVDEARRTLCHAIAPDLSKNSRDGEGCDNLGWKLCFCEAERILEEDLTHTETRCLLFMFLLRKCYLEWDNVALSHKFVRTVFYWQCERGKINSPEEEMGKNIRSVMKGLYRALSRRKLEDYFMRKRNLADDESVAAISRSIAALKRINEVLSIHIARAISTLRFSDSKVPILDFKKLIEILTEENILKMVNPNLFGLVTDGLEDDETERIDEMEMPGPSTSIQNDTEKQKQVKKPVRFNPPNINMEAILGNNENGDSAQHSAGLMAEFSKTGKRYVINPERISSENSEQPSSTKQKTTKVTVVKSTGTISAKKQNPRPEASDAFARLRKAEKEKADNQKQWMQQLINDLEMVKKRKQEKGNTERTDIFLKAEKYKPEEVAANPERRRLILSLFAKHFAYLGRRCGRDWKAFRVADLYLRHAENLTILLKEHEGYDATYDDSNEEHGEATEIMNDIATEFKVLTNLRTKRLHEKLKIADEERIKKINNGIQKDQNISSSMPDLNKKYGKSKNTNKPLKVKKELQYSHSTESHINSSDEDVHF